MDAFDPLRHVENAVAILDEAGNWPSFHDAVVNEIRLDRGDVRPDDGMWVGAVVEATLTLAAHAEPYDVRLRFHDCEAVHLGGFNHSNDILDLEFRFEPRGYLRDGRTPLSPYIHIRFVEGFGVSLDLKCFRVEAIRCPGPTRR